jgi:hypothetical protein
MTPLASPPPTTSSVPPTSPPTPNESDPAEVLDLDNDFPVDHGSPDPTGPPGNPEDSSLLNPAGLSLKELWDGFKAKGEIAQGAKRRVEGLLVTGRARRFSMISRRFPPPHLFL